MVNLGKVILDLLKQTCSGEALVREVALEACRKLSALARPGDPGIQQELQRMVKSRIPEAIMAVGLLAIPNEGILDDLNQLIDHADCDTHRILEIKVAAITALGDYMTPFLMELMVRGQQQQQQGGQIVIPQVGVPPIQMK